MAFKNPTFQDRTAQAADAKTKALNQLRTRPQPDEATVAARLAAAERRQAQLAEKSAAKQAAREAAAQAKADAAAKAAVPAPTETERKAARDARYAARKNRK